MALINVLLFFLVFYVKEITSRNVTRVSYYIAFIKFLITRSNKERENNYSFYKFY